MTITCGPERFANYIDELRPLVALHYDEVEQYSANFREGVDWEQYKGEDELGYLVSIMMRDDGKIVGYWGGNITHDQHNTLNGVRPLCLVQKVIWIMPKWRNYARRLIAEVETIALDLGVAWVALGATPKNRAGAFYEALGYVPAETTYVKVLGDAQSVDGPEVVADRRVARAG